MSSTDRIDPLAVALEGWGFGALQVALQGWVAILEQAVEQERLAGVHGVIRARRRVRRVAAVPSPQLDDDEEALAALAALL